MQAQNSAYGLLEPTTQAVLQGFHRWREIPFLFLCFQIHYFHCYGGGNRPTGVVNWGVLAAADLAQNLSNH